MTIDYFGEFKTKLGAAITAKIDELKRDGVTAMGQANLFQIVRPPQGGPIGTNARWVYSGMFNETIRTLPTKYQHFILKDPDFGA